MTLDSFVEILVMKLQLKQLAGPTLFLHPMIAPFEDLIKSLDPEVEPYAATEHVEEEAKNWAANLRGVKELEAVSPGTPLPFNQDPRVVIPYGGKFEGSDLFIGLVQETYLVWKANQKKLSAVAGLLGNMVTMKSAARPDAYAVQGNSAAVYFENGVIGWFSLFETGRGLIMSPQYFVPPGMNVTKANPPYGNLQEHLAHPMEMRDLEPLISHNINNAARIGVPYASQLMTADLQRNAKLTMLFASAHREFNSAQA